MGADLDAELPTLRCLWFVNIHQGPALIFVCGRTKTKNLGLVFEDIGLYQHTSLQIKT